MHTKTFLLAGFGILAASLATLSTDVQAEGLLSALEGRYSHHFKNGTVSGEVYESDDVVEIVPVSDNAAYIRAELSFFNGHRCSISGVGHVEGGRIVYDDGQAVSPEAAPCVLTVSRRGSSLRLDDGASSCKAYCGDRGSLSGATLPFGSRQRIRYLGLIRASQQYTEAVQSWQSQRKR